jgi:hypothetical protein
MAPAVLSLELEVPETKLVEAFRRLPARQRVRLLKVLRALCEPELRTVPVSRLYPLTGIVSLGGDALADTEAIYDGDSGH